MENFRQIFKIVGMIALLPWPMFMLMSVMMFPTGDAVNNPRHVFNVMLWLFYPAYIFALFWLFDLSLFGISGKALFWGGLGVVITAVSLFGYPVMVFNALRGVNTSGFTVTNDAVYVDGRRLQGADAATFVSLSGDLSKNNVVYENSYTKDKSAVYYMGKKVARSQPGSFSILDKESMNWAMDEHRLYYQGQEVVGATPEDYKLLSANHLIANGVVYFGVERIVGAQADSFRTLTPYFAKDAAQVYFEDRAILPESDAATFAFYPEDSDLSGFARDRRHFYDPYQNRLLSQVDPNTIRSLGRGYYKDAHAVYTRIGLEFKTLDGVDPGKFVVTNWDEATGSDANDGVSYFINGDRVKR